jgi:O-antigen ligase
MPPSLPLTQPTTTDWTRPTTLAICGAFVLSGAAALLAPGLFWVPLVAAAGVCAGILVFRHLTIVCVAWLLLAASTLEMTLADLIGPGAYQPTIAVVKTTELGLALLCVARYGLYPDLFNPGFAFLAMFVAGMGHGLYPDLTRAASLRSLLGSVAPFAFAFSRLSPRWAGAMVRACAVAALLSVAGGVVLHATGLRPLFVESGGQRLAGLGHPAFLAGIALVGIYACLIELYRNGGSRWLLLLAANFLVLLLTGARAPLACGTAVTALTFGCIRSDAFPRHRRILPLLLVGCTLPLLAVLAHDLSTMRLFNLLGGEAGNLSGRDLLWPPFQRAAAASPWFGWGVGAGNVIIPPDSELAQIIRSWAAHNEYLRISVEGGQLGRALLVGLLVLWVVHRTRRLCRTDALIMRLVFVAFAVHAYTDNVLIATTACVFFGFATAVFATRPDTEGVERIPSPPLPGAERKREAGDGSAPNR